MEPRGTVENFTTPFLVSAFVLVFMMLCTIWVIWGLIVASLISWIADRVMTSGFRQSTDRS